MTKKIRIDSATHAAFEPKVLPGHVLRKPLKRFDNGDVLIELEDDTIARLHQLYPDKTLQQAILEALRAASVRVH